MSKKDYVLIARILRETGATDETIRALAYALREGNRRFNIDRFLQACEHTEPAR